MFDGRVMHSMDYSNLDNASAAALLKGKRVTVFGSGKTAFEIASECSDANGERFSIFFNTFRPHVKNTKPFIHYVLFTFFVMYRS